MDENSVEAVFEAERIVWAAGWNLQEETALGQLTGTVGLAFARLEPRSEVIQLVAFDGEHLGHVRRETDPGHVQQWVAVLKDRARRVGTYPSAAAAAEALVRACGRSAERSG
jgi:hypothetical protein